MWLVVLAYAAMLRACSAYRDGRVCLLVTRFSANKVKKMLDRAMNRAAGPGGDMVARQMVEDA